MHTIAVITYEGVIPFHLSIPAIVFGDALLKRDTPRYQVQLCAENPGLVATLSGFHIQVDHDFSLLETADTLIIPAWPDGETRPSSLLIAQLNAAYNRGARLVGLCLGTFALAYAGLLNNLRVSTHWAWAEEFHALFPDITLDQDALYVDEGQIITSAGTAAALDCCLHILREDHGADIAARIAKRLVIAPHRHGGQSQYIEKPLPQYGQEDHLSAALDWALRHLHTEISIPTLAKRAHMSVRTFTRHFKKKTGTTLTQWLIHQRLSAAQSLLETSQASIEDIAHSTGFGSSLSLRQHFHKAFALSPSQYRKQFHAATKP